MLHLWECTVTGLSALKWRCTVLFYSEACVYKFARNQLANLNWSFWSWGKWRDKTRVAGGVCCFGSPLSERLTVENTPFLRWAEMHGSVAALMSLNQPLSLQLSIWLSFCGLWHLVGMIYFLFKQVQYLLLVTLIKPVVVLVVYI